MASTQRPPKPGVNARDTEERQRAASAPRGAGVVSRTAGFGEQQGLDDPARIRAMQQFLRARGYKIPVDGINGPLTKAAAADFRKGGAPPGLPKNATNRNPDAFNRAHNLTPHSTPAPAGDTSAVPHDARPGAGGNPGAPDAGLGNGAADPMSALIASLLKSGQGVGKLIPSSLADSAAAPFAAATAADQRQIDQNPDAKAQALADIGNWYGQAIKALGTAKTRDQAITDAGAGSVDAATKAIVGSLGGSAMGGAGSVASVGENGADTIRAIGASQGQLAEDLAPILNLSSAGAKTSTASKFDTELAALKDQLAQDQGKGAAAKAAALMQIIGQNNQIRQQNYGNQAAAVQTLAGLQASGVKTALTQAEIAKYLAQARAAGAKATNANTFAGASSKEKAAVTQAITAALVDPNTGQLKSGIDWPRALQVARNIVRSNGWAALNPSVVNGVIAPALNIAGITFSNPATLYQP